VGSGSGKKSAPAATAPELVASPKVVPAPATAAPVAAPVAPPVAAAAPVAAPVAPPVQPAAAASAPIDPVVAQAIAAAETVVAQQVQATGAVPAPNRATLDAFAAEHGIDPELASQILNRVSAKFKASRAK
jgi:flotillin